MDIPSYLSLFSRVLSDWRIIFIAIATILAWAALRYVGMVYDRRPRRRPPARSLPLPASRKPKAPRASEASGTAEEEAEAAER